MSFRTDLEHPGGANEAHAVTSPIVRIHEHLEVGARWWGEYKGKGEVLVQMRVPVRTSVVVWARCARAY